MRAIHQLTAKAVESFTAAGLYHDGGRLYFQITKRGSRSWIFRFQLRGKVRDMGLGPFPAVSLKQARQLAEATRKQVRDGVDPIQERDRSRQVAAASLTVQQAAEAWLDAQKPRWQTRRHTSRVEQRLRDYALPAIGSLPVSDIGFADIKRVLAPIWVVQHPTAERVRGDLEAIVNWSIAEGHRESESNPAELARLKHALPTGLHKVEHFPALSYEQAPAFLTELRKQDGIASCALELVLLTATRVGDVCGGGRAHREPMKWGHVNLPAATWVVPLTKTATSFTVPLSDSAIRVLDGMQRFRGPNDVVFPGRWRGSVVNAATLRRVLEGMGYAVTVHGMRSCFRTWAAETTAYPKDVIEMALAHQQSELDQAYMRGDLLDKRRRLMNAWGDFLEGKAVSRGGELVALRA